MRIQNNIESLNAYRNLNTTNRAMSRSLERLSSGYRINRAADDAAGLAISEKMRSQISGLNQAVRNAQDGISLIQTAEGALNESHSILQAMRELANQSANDTYTAEDRAAIQQDIDQLVTEITRIGETTEFNSEKLLDGSYTGRLHIGANSDQNMDIAIGDMRASALSIEGAGGGMALGTQSTQGGDGGTALEDADEVAITESQTSYDVEKLDEAVTIDSDDMDASSDDVTASYVLKNGDGDIVAVSEDGGEWFIAASAESSVGDLSFEGASDELAEAKASFGDDIKVQSGSVDAWVESNRIQLESDDAMAVFQDEEHALASGEYTVVDSSYHGVSDSGLIDSSGELVAVSDGSGVYSDIAGNTLFDVGSDLTAGETYAVSGAGGLDVSSRDAANDALEVLDVAIEQVSSQRSMLGALQNRLEHTITNLEVASENLTAAESRIRDVDMAAEMTEFTKNQILTQAGTAMLAQANMSPQAVLQLLG
ncbi:MAG: flagellin [Bacillota bacterium]